MDEPDLAGLADAFAVRESLPTEQARRVVNVVVEPEVQDQANRSGSGSTLAWIAVNYYHVLGVVCGWAEIRGELNETKLNEVEKVDWRNWVKLTEQPFTHWVCDLGKIVEGRRVVVVPVVVGYLAVETLVFVAVFA